MSTDKTLAGVQPGGRVRLGDAIPRPLEDLRDATRHVIDCADGGDDYSCGRPMIDALTTLGILEKTGRGLWSVNAREAQAVFAALSAQPSPGGQGDALRSFAFEAVEYFRNRSDVVDGDYGSPTPNEEMKLLSEGEAALAARQPVGEPAYNSAGISLTACQLHEALLMAGDPELDVPFEDRSLVRIFWTETGHSGPGLYCECVGAEEEGCILLDGTAPAIGQSAQAVDLPYSLDADQAGIRARVCDVITGTLMVGAQGHTPPPAGHWAEPFWKAARADAAAQAVDLERFRPAVMTALGLSSPYGLERETLNGLLDLIDSHGARNG